MRRAGFTASAAAGTILLAGAVAHEHAPRFASFTSGSLPHPRGSVPEYLAPELAALEGRT